MLSSPDHTLPDGRIPVLISAHARDLIAAEAGAVASYLRTHAAEMTAVAHTLRATRPVRRHRAVIRARDHRELLDGLDALYRGVDHRLVARSQIAEPARVAFVFPGQGNQWPGMAAELLGIAAYRAEVDRCHDAFLRAADVSPLNYLRGVDEADPVVIQGAQFTHAAALAATWRHYGVLPDVTVGHSLGELAAAYTAGVVDLDSATAVVVARAQLTEQLAARASKRFGMVLIAMSHDDALELIAASPGWLELSVVNGPKSVVVSGEWSAVQHVIASAHNRGVFARELPVRYPAHTSALQPLQQHLLARLPRARFYDAPVEFIGSVHGGPIPPTNTFGQYWFDNLRNQVRFDLATDAALARGVTSFIEMSAHPTLLVPLSDRGGAAQILGSTVRDQPAGEALAANIVAAAIADAGYRWQDFAPRETPLLLRNFPHAPMHTNRLWAGAHTVVPARREPVVVTEHWQPIPVPGTCSARVAVIDYTGKSPELTAELVAALGESRTAKDSTDAELVLLVAPPEDTTAIDDAATRLAEHAAAQTTFRPGRNCRRVWLLTCGAETPDGESSANPGAAALAALHRSIGFDHPDHTFAHLDLPTTPTTLDFPAAAAALCLSETEVAVRAGKLAVRRLVEAESATGMLSIPETVLISGGTGAIGMEYAGFCARHGARDIVLLSRRGVTDPTAVDELRAATGAHITVMDCDITDEDAIAAAIDRYRPTPAGLLVHTASAPAIAGSSITTDAVRDAFGAKVIGLQNLTRRWPLRVDARILVCSSVLALWGGSGHGLYAAANRMADIAVAQLRERGHDATSVRWGLWSSVAVVQGQEKDRIARTGLIPMSPEAAIRAGFSPERRDPAILSADFDRLRVFFDSQGVTSPFDRSLNPESADALDDRDLAQAVAEGLVSVLGLESADDLDLHRPLVDLGLDSLLALDLRKRLGRATGLRVALGPLLAGMTAAQLMAALSDDATSAESMERTVFTHD